MGRQRAAGPFEIWAARAWNVFNEGRPFSVVYPALVLLCAAPWAWRPTARSASRSPVRWRSRWCSRGFAFPLRGRALLWLGALASIPLLEPWRAPALLAGALAGYVVLHGRGLGLDLLPPAHRRAVDQRPALLAARAHELGPHERQRARAGAEAADDAERRHPAGRGAGARLGWRGSRAVAALAALLGRGRLARASRARGCRATPPARRPLARRPRSPGAST